MVDKAIQLKKELIRKRNAVRNKLKALKEGEINQELSFLPITKQLKSISSKLERDTIIKDENLYDELMEDNKFHVHKSPRTVSQRMDEYSENVSFTEAPVIAEHIPETSSVSDDNDEYFGDLDQNVQDAKEYIRDLSDSPYMESFLQQLSPLPRKYIHDMFKDVKNEFDFKYGVRYSPKDNTLMIGNSAFELDGKNILINNLTYRGTPGLYELLFKKHPLGYNKNDLKVYLDIVKQTNAHRRNYSENEQIQGNGSYKYKTIISALNVLPTTPRRPRTQPFSSKKRLGEGMTMEVLNKSIDYVHWDDPNELVDRLRLLVASQTAGHSGHTNEINSILEELREAKIIK